VHLQEPDEPCRRLPRNPPWPDLARLSHRCGLAVTAVPVAATAVTAQRMDHVRASVAEPRRGPCLPRRRGTLPSSRCRRPAMAAPPPCWRACDWDRPRPPLTLPRPRACRPQPRQSPCSPEARAPPPLSPQTATPTRHCRVVAASTPRCRVRGVASPRCTHGRTHTPVTALDRIEAARDPGDADKWDQGVSRSGKRRKRKRKRRRNGPGPAQQAQEREEPRRTFGPKTRSLFPFSSCTALTRGSHLSVRPAD